MQAAEDLVAFLHRANVFGDLGPAEHRPAGGFDELGQLIVGQRAVALKVDHVNEHVLTHLNDQHIARPVDPHVCELAGGVERFQGVIEPDRFKILSHPDRQDREDRAAGQALVAAHDDLFDRAGAIDLRRQGVELHRRGRRGFEFRCVGLIAGNGLRLHQLGCLCRSDHRLGAGDAAPQQG